MAQPKTRILERDIRVQYLFSWKHNDLFLSKLLMFLKEKPIPSWLSLLCGLYLFEGSPSIVFVSVPNSKFSLRWAQSVSLERGGVVFESLFWAYKKGPHKNLSRSERRLSRIQVLDLCWEPDPHTKYILLDDIVTSGATALAVYEALSRPRDFEVWTLSCRF